MEAAKVIFLSEGYAAASMDRISEQAGVSKMTVYRHFKDKEALFIETINQQCDGIYQFGSHEPAASRDEAISELKSYGAAFINLVTAPDVLGIYQTLLGEMLRFPDLGRMFFDIVIAKSIESIRHILSGIFPPEQADWRAPAFMHLVMGDSYQRLSLGKLTRAECLERSAEEIDRAARLIVCNIDD
ncbi:TetR/AcrR family transcriptional regulator [Altererythrobacter sp. BO-6]|uniref:TetR/AcrR family transcriptional regulator n=1 Tax=Altererythrobacter sp. BO-6 TaxID=2604537 RepID=UPI0019CF8D15|nr:TetR/AcrR family transcriptional regulator [Altererythrobacter sp. BO-6]